MNNIYENSLWEIDKKLENLQNKKKIKQYYSLVGKMFIFRTLLTFIISAFIVSIYIVMRYTNINEIEFKDIKLPQIISILYTVISYTIANSIAYIYVKQKKKKYCDLSSYTKLAIDRYFFILVVFGLGIQSLGALVNELLIFLKINVYSGVSFFNISEDIFGNTLVIVYLLVIAPITEEILFRGVALKCFSVVDIKFGIFMSSLLFGLSHGTITQCVFTFFTGVIFSCIVIRYNSLVMSIICHVILNLTSVLFAYVEYVYHIKALKIENIYYISIFILMIIFLIYILLNKKSNISRFIKSILNNDGYIESENIKVDTINLIIWVPSIVIMVIFYVIVISTQL